MSAIDANMENLPDKVGEVWDSLANQRDSWERRVEEVREYVTSPTTKFTEVGSSLPWKNKTTIPVLTQIADSLQAYYMAALMPSDDWFRWEGRDIESQEKAQLIEEYMKTKINMSGFRNEMSKLIRDFIIYGNMFAGISYVKEETVDFVSGETISNYQGPKLQRISPLDCVIDIHAKDFDSSPFITRRMIPISDIVTHNESVGGVKYLEEGVAAVLELRKNSYDQDFLKKYTDRGLRIDGFNSFEDYLSSQYVEVLEFWGDVFDREAGTLHKNIVVTVADKSHLLRIGKNPSWDGKKPFIHVGWRILPDNLYGQGPLENLVGMQYRIDHLENLKADAFDQIIHPMIKVVGDTVEDFSFGPGRRVYVGSDGDVQFMQPDVSVLTADNQIAIYREYMEFVAGSPREAVGFRTPGEKTAFEVSTLQQGADRMFQDKLNQVEENGMQRILNLFFELMIRNFDVQDVARVFNEDTGALKITQFSKEDVVANGVFRPMGAKYYSARAKRIQELQNMIMIAQNPAIGPHFSGLRAGKMLEEELGFEKWNVVEENIGIKEQVTTQAYAQQIQQAVGMQQQQQEPK